MGYFNLPYGVRVAGSDPIDGDRYLAIDLAARNALIPAERAKAGQQVYVESEHKLYILAGNTNFDWIEIQTGSGNDDLNHIHVQDTENTQWYVTHNLNKYPAVQVIGTDNKMIECEVTHLNNVTTVLNFNVPFKGIAIFN